MTLILWLLLSIQNTKQVKTWDLDLWCVKAVPGVCAMGCQESYVAIDYVPNNNGNYDIKQTYICWEKK